MKKLFRLGWRGAVIFFTFPIIATKHFAIQSAQPNPTGIAAWLKKKSFTAEKIKGLGMGLEVAWIILLIVGILGGQSSPPPSATPEVLERHTEQESAKTAPLAPSETPQAAQSQGTVMVTRVIDGDTIEIEGGQRVRYVGIDTPETVDPRKPVQCFGVEASNYNKQLVEGKRVRLEKDVSESDRYGRLLRYVYVDDAFVNLILVQEGFASSYTYPPDIKYQDQFVEAQQTASEQKKGLWGSCPTTTETSTPAPAPSSLEKSRPSDRPLTAPRRECCRAERPSMGTNLRR